MRSIPEPIIRPPALHPGSRVALIAPAGPIDDARLPQAAAMCKRLGLVPVTGRAAGRRTGFLAGSDSDRAADLQWAVDDPSIDAIWALRGGYGTVRLLSSVKFEQLRVKPKPYIGFSDNTAVLVTLAKHGLVSFHAPHAGGDFPEFAEEWFERILFDGYSGALATPQDNPLVTWIPGEAEGRVIGGNLAILAAAEGTPFDMPSDHAILFIEDVTEPPYRLDRLMMQLKLSGALDKVRGIVIGQITDCDDNNASGLDTIRNALSHTNIPVIANAPIGHVPDNWTIPVGVMARIDAGHDGASMSILEPGVTTGATI
jgi:muramoyltetrapeptide carboxypeptidase